MAGPSALVVAKVHKLNDRAGEAERSSDKDALDVLRLLQVIPTAELVRRMERLLGDPRSRSITERALARLPEFFGRPRAPGCTMAGRAVEPLEDPDVVVASAAALCGDLMAGMGGRP